MATTYYALNEQNSVAVTTDDGADITVPFSFDPATLSPTPYAFVINDVVKLVKLPKGAVITDLFIDLPGMDSGSTLTLDVGLETVSTTAILSASTMGRNATAALFLNGGNLTAGANANGYTKGTLPLYYSADSTGDTTKSGLAADDVLQIKAHAASTGGGNGSPVKLVGWVRYNMRSTVF